MLGADFCFGERGSQNVLYYVPGDFHGQLLQNV